MHRIGMLTPSSNTVLEPVSARLVRDMPDISLHVSRFRVTQIALDAAALGQFDDAPMLDAAELLGHAKVDVITWNGTSASWLGLDTDRRLVQRIQERTGIPATTCVLTLADLLRRHGLSRIGLITPYTSDVQERIVANLRREGFETVTESHLGIRDNHAFGLVSAGELDRMMEAVAAAKPDAVVVLCTNLAGAPRVADWELRFGIPVLDSVLVTLFGALIALGAEPKPLGAFGRLLAD